MAYDDMEVVMYKILRYLYECMKAGKRPVMEDMNPCGKLGRINESYWKMIMRELIEHEYIKDFTIIHHKGGDAVMMGDNPRISLEGVQFMNENSGM